MLVSVKLDNNSSFHSFGIALQMPQYTVNIIGPPVLASISSFQSGLPNVLYRSCRNKKVVFV